MSQEFTINHNLATVVFTPTDPLQGKQLATVIRYAMDEYLQQSHIPAEAIHQDRQQKHGEDYCSSGYYLRLYRQRANLTQAELAKQTQIRQHHLSEIENNKRVLGKANAKKLAEILQCDYQKLL